MVSSSSNGAAVNGGNNKSRRYIGFLLLVQSILIVLFGFFVDYHEATHMIQMRGKDNETSASDNDNSSHHQGHQLSQYYPSI